MVVAEHPVTRSELREELNLLRREFREHYAAKSVLRHQQQEQRRPPLADAVMSTDSRLFS